jgi:hypothetical protein
VSHTQLESRLKQEYRADGYRRAKVRCARVGDAYRCAALRNGIDSSDGIVRTTYSLTGDQKGDTSLASP